MQPQQNIHYELTKQRTSQAIRGVAGARNAFGLIDAFLQKHATDLKYSNPSVAGFIWVTTEPHITNARQLKAQLIEKYGKPDRQGYQAPPKDYFNEMFEWLLKPGDLPSALDYVDSLGPLPGLQPRPPVSVVVSANFELAKPGFYAEKMNSHMIAWLSPKSNSVCLDLEFPFEEADSSFASFRAKLQSDCPVPLEDKYFYTRKRSAKGSYSFRRLYK